MMLFDYKGAASKYRTEVLSWDGGSELGRQELGKEHSTTAGEMILNALYGRCTMPSVLRLSSITPVKALFLSHWTRLFGLPLPPP